MYTVDIIRHIVVLYWYYYTNINLNNNNCKIKLFIWLVARVLTLHVIVIV